MFDRRDIRAAVENGVLTTDQADRFEGFLKSRSDPDRMLDPENLRFLTNFNDIFLTIGLGILITGVAFLSGNLIGTAVGFEKMALVLTPLPVLAVAWLLAEYFAGRRRLLLPSMALSGVICWCAAISVAALLAPNDGPNMMSRSADNIVAGISYAGFGAAALAALAIHLRFRLPFALFLMALALAGVFYTAVAQLGDLDMLAGGLVTLIAGVVTLIVAIGFDARDPNRASLNSDNAFWLHMAAAPQIMFGLRGLILGSGFAPASMADATVMLVALLLFGALSLALNRRALIVSGLISFSAAMWVIVQNLGGGGVVTTLMLTALLVGGAIVLLGGGWRTARRALLKVTPTKGFAGRIFPPEPA